jgi:uroporphyrin-III C-methyltransferase
MGLSHLISIVGAGPGSPDLLTVIAQKRVTEADVILYDALIGDEILKLAKNDAEKIYVGKLYKDGQNQEERQNEIHSQFLKFSKQNKKVVRLKAGDPMIFGRGAEEVRFCKNNKLNYEVIPGITAGIAASSLMNIPLTERDKNAMVLFYTGQRKNGGFSDLDSIAKVLQSGSPVIIYMGLNNLADLAAALLKEKIEAQMPVQILSRVSQTNQKNYTTNLGEVSFFLKNNSPETPCIIIIGENAASI